MTERAELDKLLKEINEHNEHVFNNVKPTEKIDFSKTKKSWGATIIPSKFHIDKNKTYKTLCGYDVVITNIQLMRKDFKGNEIEVTFPVKGHYLKPRKNGKKQQINCIWTLDGRSSLILKDNELTLIEV